MGAEVALGVAIFTGVKSMISQNEAKEAASQAADQQRRVQSEQKAIAASQQAEARRQAIREERVRRARILQGAENTGTALSSGETGALGSLSTSLSSRIGEQVGANQASNNINQFSQAAADFNFKSQQSQQDARMFESLGDLSANIFSAIPKKQTSTGSGDPVGPQ